MLFYGTQIDEEEEVLLHGAKSENGESKAFGIHLYEFVGHVLVFIQHARTMLHALGYSGPILIETALTSVRGVKWLYSPSGSWLTGKAGSVLDDNVTFSIPATSEALREKSDRVAMDVLRYVFFSVNWPSLIAGPQDIENLVRKGYEFNSWPQPANLQV